MSRRSTLAALFLCLGLSLGLPFEARSQAGPEAASIPFPDLARLEASVAAQLSTLPELVEGAQASGDVETLGEACRIYQAYDFLATALACYQRALVHSPRDYRWRYYLATTLETSGDLAAAVEAYRASLEILPAGVAARVRLGNALVGLGRLKEAKEAFELALTTAPEEPSALAGLGQVAFSQRRFADAVSAFERVLRLMPAASSIHYPLAQAYRNLGDLEAARRHLQQAGKVGIRPPDPLIDELESLKSGERVNLLTGRRAFAAGDFNAAALYFQRAVEADDRSVTAHINLAAALERLGRLAEARQELERAVELAPQNANAHYNLGLTLSRLGAGAAGIEKLRIAAELAPADIDIRLALAIELRRAGRAKEALDLAEQLIELAPHREQAPLEAAGAAIDLGNLGLAVAHLRRAHAAFPTHGPIALALAKLLVAAPEGELRDGAFGLELTQRLFEALPTAEHAALQAAALAELGRCDEAASWQRKALDLAGSSPPQAFAELLRQYREDRPCRLPVANRR